MGIPAPQGVGATGTPPPKDQANAVVQGQFTAIGPSEPFAIYGAANAVIWAEANTTLTTTDGSGSAAVGSATGLAVGQTINSVNVPAGTTIKTLSGTDITLGFAPNASVAQVIGGADAAALFVGAAWDGVIKLERSFDGGQTFLVCGVGGAGQGAIYTGSFLAGQPVSIVFAEPERMVLYRFNCTALASGQPKYRISTTGLAAMTWGVPIG